MNKELYVSSTPHETKVALVEDDQLAEVFFERENEYTLAGSIYKGRVTRVLPGMQSAFVDIGLERDAFLYVSDFMELADDEESEEFGEIPAPRGAIDAGKTQESPQAQASETEPEADEENSTATQEFDISPDDEGGEPHVAGTAGEDREQGEGARRWRGRRRRGGRRWRSDEREPRPEPNTDNGKLPVEESAPAARSESRGRTESRPRQDFGPPAGYTPIMLPGESISKYRNQAPPVSERQNENMASETSAAEVEEQTLSAQSQPPSVIEAHDWSSTSDQAPSQPDINAVVAEDVHDSGQEKHAAETQSSPQVEHTSEAAHVEEHRPAAKRHWWSLTPETTPAPKTPTVAAAEETQSAEPVRLEAPGHQPEQPTARQEEHTSWQQGPQSHAVGHLERSGDRFANTSTHGDYQPVVEPAWSQTSESSPAADQHATSEMHSSDAAVARDSSAFPSLTAPTEAPEGRTLEHEILEDEEAEFQPVPDDLNALSEVAGDEELVLEEETLDSDNGYSDRWVPKIADVDEDEVIAAEMRGEKLFEAESAEEADEEDSEEGEVEETNGHAELRAASPTAGYQLRRAERPGPDRGSRDRSRRGGPRRNMRARPNSARNQPLITDLLKEGQEVLIQIAKEPIGKKGARITSHIALPGRFLVYMPTVNHVGVSRKIASDEERQRLKRIVTSERENGIGGFIVRTAAANIKEDELRADIRFLKHLWAEIKTRAENSKPPALIYHDLNLVERVLRDQVNADFSQIWVDTEDQYERVVRFASRFQPSLVRRIKLYTKDTPLYEQFGIQEEIDRSLKSKVWLKSGGYIVINQTEALVAIDINTGKYVGKTQRLEDTIVKTNVDAIKEIVRQIRLRDLGGIIVIDFIDMDERKNRQKVMQALEEALRSDRAPSKVLQFNDFGLVAITRKRVKQSLERTLGEPCSYCDGAGFIKSVPTVCNELYIEMRKMAKVHDKSDITVRVNPEVAKALKANNAKLISEMEELTGKTVLVKNDPLLHQEKFDIQ
jgi:Rne/Rng family ribonuclease